jgi:hypothetical protein
MQINYQANAIGKTNYNFPMGNSNTNFLQIKISAKFITASY